MKSLYVSYCLMGLLVFCSLQLSAQYASTRLYTTADGLPANEIHSLDISPDGRLLIALSGGRGGLYWYNGKKVTPFLDSIKQNFNALFWDLDDNLHLSSYNKIYVYDGTSLFNWIIHDKPDRRFLKTKYTTGDTISQAGRMRIKSKHNPYLFEYLPNTDHSVYQLSDSHDTWVLKSQYPNFDTHQYWNGLLDQLNLSPNQRATINNFEPTSLLDDNLKLNIIRAFNIPNSSKTLFLQNGQFKQLLLEPSLDSFKLEKNPLIYYSIRDQQYQLLVEKGSDKHVYYLDENLNQMDYFVFKSNSPILKIVKDQFGTLWAATHDGLLRIFPHFTNFFLGENPSKVLSSTHALHGDKDGRLWFGSYGNGIAYIKDNQVVEPSWNQPFKVLPGTAVDAQGRPIFVLSGIYQYVGLHRINGAQQLEPLGVPIQGYYLTKNQKRSLMYGSSKQGLLIQTDPDCYEEDCWQKLDASKGLGLSNVISAVQDDLQRYWMTRGSVGVAVYLPTQDTIYNFFVKKQQVSFASMAMLRTSDNGLFIGTQKGLALFQPPATITSTDTADHWLSYIDTTIQNEEQYVLALKNLDKEYLTYTSNAGFHILNKTSLATSLPTIHSFNHKNGYLGQGGEQNAIWVDTLKQQIWMCNDRGISRFNTKYFHPSLEQPVLKLDKIGGSFFNPKNTRLTTDLGRAEAIEVRYHLESNLDPFADEYFIWQLNKGQKTQTRDSIFTLQNLRAGSYQLTIQGFRNGVASAAVSIQIRVPGPFYTKPLFILLFLGILVALALAYYYFLQNKRRKQKEDSNRKIHNLVGYFSPHFLGNSFNWIKNRAKLSKDNEAAVIVTKMDKIVRTLFQSSRNKKISHSLAEELQLLQAYFDIQKVRYGDAHAYQIEEIDPDLELDTIHIPVLTLQLLCDNAIEHGLKKRKDGKGNVWVRINSKEAAYEILIEDDGIGREKAARLESEGFSTSVKILQELFQELNHYNKVPFIFKYTDGIFLDGSGEKFGTRCQLLIPKNYNYEI